MSNRWFNVVVVLLWLASMSWLITEKVAPPLLVGERPQAAKEDSQEPPGPVAWQLWLNDQPLGWASTQSAQRPDQVVELRNRLHLDRFPLKEIAPWLARLLNPEGRHENTPFDAETRIELADGQLAGFRTSIHFSNMPEALQVNGRAEGDQLKIHVRAGTFQYDTATRLSANAPAGDSLSPRTRLANLHVGQSWTEPVYNPLQPPQSPMEILQATVERTEPIAWDGQILNAAVVVYRSDSGSQKGAAHTLRARAWVHANGDVLKQEIFLLGVKLLFVRMPPGSQAAGMPAEALPAQPTVTAQPTVSLPARPEAPAASGRPAP